MKAKSNRIVWLDICKGMLILFVLLSHSRAPLSYTRFFSGFFLTTFFFVSGYTFSIKNSFKEFIIGKTRRLLVPLLSMGAVKMVLAHIIEGDNIAERIKGLLFQISGYNDDLWFIGCLFTASLLFYCILRISNKAGGAWSMAVISFGTAIVGWISILVFNAKLPWQMENALVMTFYMMLGYQYRQHEAKMESTIENKILPIVFACVYLLMVLLVDSEVNIHRGIYTNPAAHIFESLLAIPVFVVLAKRLSNTDTGKLIQRIGRNTLFLYAFENYVILPFYLVCGRMGLENSYILSICCVAVTIAVLSPFAWIANRYFSWMVGGNKK